MAAKKKLVQNQSTKDDPIIAALPKACCDELVAVEFMEKQRWGDHPACPRCGDLDVYQMKNSKTEDRQANFRWRCHGCKDQFTVRIGTVFEESRIPMRHWCFGFWRAAASKKGVSALEIHRQTGLSYKSSLFMLHRIRFAMQDDSAPQLGGNGNSVEVDELYVGGKPRRANNAKSSVGIKRQKSIVLGLKERGGNVRPRVIADVTSKTLEATVQHLVKRNSRILTDEASGYRGIGKLFDGGHESVCHGRYEYVRGDIHTNSIEGFFGQVRRSLDGIYHNVSHKHLHRYLSECEFRHNLRKVTDGQRVKASIRSANNKRLTYADQVGA